MGGVGPFLIRGISYDLAVRAIQAAPRCCLPWVAFLVVTRLTLIHKVIEAQADLWVVAVLIVQPYLVVYYSTRLIMAYLTQPAVNGQPVVYVALPGHPPRFAFIELFLVHAVGLLAGSLTAHHSGVCYTGRLLCCYPYRPL